MLDYISNRRSYGPGRNGIFKRNIVMFIPIGLLLGRRIGWQGMFVAAWISVAIEVKQLMTGRGLCEIDDVIHNSFGAAIGMMVINRFIRKEGEY